MIDLHTHSTASDGTDTPAELIEKAKKNNLEAIALTDHDTLAGLDEAETAARDLGIYFVRGCELSTRTDYGSIHILGLWLPRNCESLESYLATMRKKRDDRNKLMIEKLRACGVNVSLEDVAAKANGSVGRPHMAAVLVDKGYAEDKSDAFRLYLGEGSKAYVPKASPDPATAVRLLNGVGATVAIAHPLLPPPKPLDWLERLVISLKGEGLTALEAWHSAHDKKSTEWLINLARRLGLGVTGGSDYHGDAKPTFELGLGTGDLNIPRSVLDKLLERRVAKGLPC